MVWIERNPEDILDSTPQSPNLTLNICRIEASMIVLDSLF